MDQDALEEGGRKAASRREFIRRGALALGLTAWGVPLVQVVRGSHHGGSQDIGTGPEEIGVQQVTAACTTCAVECESVTQCGTDGIFICFCAPSADVYPIAPCVCASEVFCGDATPCTGGCPPGWACVQGCCDFPVCLPPCPEGAPLFAQEGATEQGQARGDGRLTVAGRRI